MFFSPTQFRAQIGPELKIVAQMLPEFLHHFYQLSLLRVTLICVDSPRPLFHLKFQFSSTIISSPEKQTHQSDTSFYFLLLMMMMTQKNLFSALHFNIRNIKENSVNTFNFNMVKNTQWQFVYILQEDTLTLLFLTAWRKI